MSIRKVIYRTSLASLIVLFFGVLPALAAADIPPDSKAVSDLLSQAKTEAAQLKDDAVDMDSFTLSNLAWQTHAAKITAIKEDVNKVGETVAKLNKERATASPWQQTAIDRINPILREQAANTTAVINHLNKEQGRLLNNQEHKDYLKANADLATRMASVISDFVDYGQTKAKFEELSRKLEVSEK